MAKKKILVADLLCGAGGSSTGCERALNELGLEMELVCVNHWGVAIDTHKLNHPNARHYVQDIATVRPHLIVPEGYLDLLMASPTCTHHSVARGGKPTSDQQRSDPWHIITWFTELRVKRAIIENVWEYIGWGPVDPKTGKPIPSRKGEYFNAWVDTIRRLGATSIEYRKLNAADYGDATTRQRFIMMIRFDRKPIIWPVPTHMKRPDEAGLTLFPTLKPWKPAREIIDWNLKGRSIFNRKKPLASKTLARIYAGAIKFKWPEPYLVILRNHMATQGLDMPVPTIAANGLHIGLAQPVIINGRKGNQAQGVSEAPIPTLDTKGGVWLAEPMVLSQHNSGAARSVADPVPTITTGGAGAENHPGCARPILIEPFILNRHGEGYGESRAHSVEEPTPTANCDGGGYQVEPFVLSAAHGVSADESNPHNRRVKSVDEPIGAIHAGGGNFAVVEPFVLSQGAGGAPRAVEDPVPTIPTAGAHALIAPYYSSGSGETCTSDEGPLPTLTTKARLGMVVPVTHSTAGNGARNVSDPIPTMTTAKGGEFAVVMPVTHQGEGNRARDVSEPIPTVTGANRGELAFIAADDQYDILFRMLEPHELAAAMGFTSEEHKYEFAGTKTDQVKQIGNAVSVAKMKACVGAIMADAVPRQRAKPLEKLEAA